MPVVDELVIKVGLEAGDLQRGLELFLGKIQEFAQVLGQALGQGIAESMQGIGEAAGEMGEAAQQAGQQGAEGMRQLARESRHARNQITSDARQIQRVSRGISRYVRGLVRKFAGPIMGAFAFGSMANNYISDLGKVAELTGSYNKTLEEERKKKAQLQRITKEDLELYKKARESLVSFQLATQSLGNALMRAFAPAIEKIIGWLNRFTDFLERNQDNIVRFCKVAAGVIGTILIPAFVALGIAMLKSPFTWVVLAILALILIIDDLIVYINGGKTAFGGLWEKFGTGKEIAEKLSKAWKTLKEVFSAVASVLPSLIAGFVAFKTAVSIGVGLHKIAGAFRAITSGIGLATAAWRLFAGLIMAHPIALIIGLIAAACVYVWQNFETVKAVADKVWNGIKSLCESVANAVKGAWDAAINWIASKFQWLFDMVDKVSGAWNKMTGSIGNWAPGLAKTFGIGGGPIPAGATARAGAAAGGGAGNVTQNNQRSVSQKNQSTINIYGVGGEPGAVAGAARRGVEEANSKALTSLANTGNED